MLMERGIRGRPHESRSTKVVAVLCQNRRRKSVRGSSVDESQNRSRENLLGSLEHVVMRTGVAGVHRSDWRAWSWRWHSGGQVQEWHSGLGTRLGLEKREMEKGVGENGEGSLAHMVLIYTGGGLEGNNESQRHLL